jgi:hypothetical protein
MLAAMLRPMAFGLPSQGTRRLRIALSAGSLAGLLAALALILVLYGAPYWRGWWVVIAAILVASVPGGILVAHLVEWVVAGYRGDAEASAAPRESS